jgi:hypothetical protein
MNPEQQNFESLRRLMALKRHEVPPPGYFHRFSDRVVSRLRAGERGEEPLLHDLFSHAPWLKRLLTAFETKPIFAGAFGAAICGLLVAGVIYSEAVTPTAVTLHQTPPGERLPVTVQIGTISESSPIANFPNSGGGVALPVAGSLFGQMPTVQPQAIVFRPAN